jgi:aminopeptidase N
MARLSGWAVIVGGLVFAPRALPADVVPGHHLPGGKERPVREREIDIRHIVADLRLDLDQETVEGRLTVRFTPLRNGLSALSLDAADIEVKDVTLAGTTGPLAFVVRDRALEVTLPRPLKTDETAELLIDYVGHPRIGLYFQPRAGRLAPQVWNYGEGGRHYTWLPLYNDTNDRFTAELRYTVARPYEALGNGVLKETRENKDGTRTFVWLQEKPIANYLLALDAGEFGRVTLDDARVKERQVPLAVYASPGREAGAFAFKNTPRMIEFFSERYSYPYPWAKYDQIALRNFAIGAMETTGLVGFEESNLHVEGDPPDSAPAFEEAWPTWTYEDTISHELAHHWFGDLVTCRSLGSIFLNESFASFSHTLWNEGKNGADDAAYQRFRYLDRYLGYVRKTGEVRPLQYFRWKSAGDMYQSETTYIKGALVLQSLRHLMGDDDFFRGLGDYLRRNEFGEVEARDLQIALERASGRDLGPFFGDWIVEGGGHPAFEVGARYVAERKAVDLTVRQIQADLPFENAFHLPVDVEIATATGTRVHRVDLNDWSTQVSLPADEAPAYVAFDAGGWLVAEVAYARPIGEVLAQLDRGGVASKLRAARQLAEDFPRREEARTALGRLLLDPKAHWGVRQEAARGLGSMGESAALVTALSDRDRRVRRAAALALGETSGPGVPEALGRAVEADTAEDVVAVAAHSLGRRRAPGAAAFLKAQLAKDSRWQDARRLGAVLGLAELEDASLVPVFRAHLDVRFERTLRVAALEGWARAAPRDPELLKRLRELLSDRNPVVRQQAVTKLGEAHQAEDARLLQELAGKEADPDLAEAARAAAADIDGFLKKPHAE